MLANSQGTLMDLFLSLEVALSRSANVFSFFHRYANACAHFRFAPTAPTSQPLRDFRNDVPEPAPGWVGVVALVPDRFDAEARQWDRR